MRLSRDSGRTSSDFNCIQETVMKLRMDFTVRKSQETLANFGRQLEMRLRIIGFVSLPSACVVLSSTLDGQTDSWPDGLPWTPSSFQVSRSALSHPFALFESSQLRLAFLRFPLDLRSAGFQAKQLPE
jgi:hypothetical protein